MINFICDDCQHHEMLAIEPCPGTLFTCPECAVIYLCDTYLETDETETEWERTACYGRFDFLGLPSTDDVNQSARLP